MGGVGGGYLCIDNFQDRKYPKTVAKDMRRSVFRMGTSLKNFGISHSAANQFFLLASCWRQRNRGTIYPLDDDIQAFQGETNRRDTE